jgi:aspartyl/glutamyl-tRNA(Asn/Gln) amidotransferase C subunit
MSTPFSHETILRIAELARLKLTQEELIQQQKELTKIFNAFESLSNIPLPSELLSPQDARSMFVTSKVTHHENDNMSRMRTDHAENSLSAQEFLSQAPQREGVFVRVPAILTPST